MSNHSKVEASHEVPCPKTQQRLAGFISKLFC